MNNKKISPLEVLRAEKQRMKRQYVEDEKRISEDWEYLTSNIGTLTFNTILKGSRDLLTGEDLKKEHSLIPRFGNNSVLNTITSSLPLLWDIAQPILLGYAVKRVKSMFSSKKNKKKN